MYWSVMNELSDSSPCTSLAAARSGPSSTAAATSSAATAWSLIGTHTVCFWNRTRGSALTGAMNPQSWTFNRADYARERAQQIREAMNAHVRLNEMYAQRKAGLQGVTSSATSRPHTAASQPDRHRVRIPPLLPHDAATPERPTPCQSGPAGRTMALRWLAATGRWHSGARSLKLLLALQHHRQPSDSSECGMMSALLLSSQGTSQSLAQRLRSGQDEWLGGRMRRRVSAPKPKARARARSWWTSSARRRAISRGTHAPALLHHPWSSTRTSSTVLRCAPVRTPSRTAWCALFH